METKRIAILSCLKATEVCSGAACFKAVNQRTNFFEVYKGALVEVIGFFHCNGCTCDYEKDVSYLEKMNMMIKLKPDAIHVGKCTMIEGTECPIITEMIQSFIQNDIIVVRGTH